MLPIAQNMAKLKYAEVATRCHVKRIYFLKFFFAFLSVHIGTKICSRGKSDYYVFIKYSFHDDNMMIKKNMSMQIWIKIWWCWQERCIIVEQCTTWTRVAQAAAYYNRGVRWMESCCWPDHINRGAVLQKTAFPVVKSKPGYISSLSIQTFA